MKWQMKTTDALKPWPSAGWRAEGVNGVNRRYQNQTDHPKGLAVDDQFGGDQAEQQPEQPFPESSESVGG